MLTEKQENCVRVYEECNRSEIETAKVLNIGISSVRKHLWLAHRKGLNFNNTEEYSTVKVSSYTNSKGTTQEWKQQLSKPKTNDDVLTYLATRTPINKFKIAPPQGVDENVQLEWTLADAHYGMLAWGEECGEDYDLNIARELILDSASDIFRRSGKVKETVLVLMGDNFHADSTENQTRKSHHSLDVDSRYPKIIMSGVDTFASAIETCLRYSEKVKVIVLYGNHDESSSMTLPIILHYYFLKNKRVIIDLGKSKNRFHFWGANATIYAHGDTTKPDRLCAELMQYIATNDMYGMRFFHAKQAHLHKEEIMDINGVVFERVPSPVAKDSFASAGSYGSRRATVATMYHKNYGEEDRYTITPLSLKRRKDNLIK